MTTLSKRALNRALLARQMLLERETITAVDAVARLVGLQAQVARPPFVGLWTRVQGFERAELARALGERTVVRVTAMRGTLHLMTASDYVATRGALHPMLTRGARAILRERTSTFDLDALNAEARRFFGKTPATFDALRDHLVKKFPEGDERAMGYTVRTHLPLVQVPTDAPWGFPAAADFALADGWLGRKISTSPASAETLATQTSAVRASARI
jgi:hypothetical protein